MGSLPTFHPQYCEDKQRLTGDEIGERRYNRRKKVLPSYAGSL